MLGMAHLKQTNMRNKVIGATSRWGTELAPMRYLTKTKLT